MISSLVRIHKLENAGYVAEWKHAYQGMKGPAHPVWLDNSAIVLFEVTFDNVPIPSNLKKRPVVVEWKEGEWNGPRPIE